MPDLIDILILIILTHLYNIVGSQILCIGLAVWVVIPFFKKGDWRLCSNYRLIILLSLP